MPNAVQTPQANSPDPPNGDELDMIEGILSIQYEQGAMEVLIGLISHELDSVYPNSHPGLGWHFRTWAVEYYRGVIRQLQRFIQPHPSLESSLTGIEHHLLEEAGDEASNRPPDPDGSGPSSLDRFQ